MTIRACWTSVLLFLGTAGVAAGQSDLPSTPASSGPGGATAPAGICTVFLDAGVFDTAFPLLALEDFEDGNVAPGGFVSCAASVDSSGDGGTCFDPGDIEEGLTVSNPAEGGLICLLGIGYVTLGNELDNNCVISCFEGNDTVMAFDPPVHQVGVFVEGFFPGPSKASIEVRDPGGVPVWTDNVLFPGVDETFWGLSCESIPVGSISVAAPSSQAFFVNSVRFGTVGDCNANGTPDAEDIATGDSEDADGDGVPDECEALGRSYCGPGRPNSTGSPGSLVALGSDRAADMDLLLAAHDLPPGNVCLFLASAAQGSVQPPRSCGPICLMGPDIARYKFDAQLVDADGRCSLVVDPFLVLTNPPQPILAGQTWNFQAWHRDADAGPDCNNNFTDAVEVAFR